MNDSEMPRSIRVETREDLFKRLDEAAALKREDYIPAEEFWNNFDDFRHRVRQRETVNV